MLGCRINMDKENYSKVVSLPVDVPLDWQTPEAMLEQYLAAGDAREEGTYLYATRPALRAVTLRLARYLTHALPSPRRDERSLFDECLDLAISEWVYAARQSALIGRQNAYFLRALVAHLPILQEWSIYLCWDDQFRLWNPTLGPLGEWGQRVDATGMKIVREPPDRYWAVDWSPRYFREKILHHFLLIDEATMGMVAGYEDFVLS